MPTQAKQQNSQLSGFEPYVEKKGEEYMGEPMRKHFTKILQKWKQDLMQEVDRTVDHMKDEAANFPDPSDRASQEEEFSLELRARDRERKLIKKIDKTLQLIEDEEYGWCESCGVEIGIRLGLGGITAGIEVSVGLGGFRLAGVEIAVRVGVVGYSLVSTFRLDGVVIGRNTVVNRAILDKYVKVEEGAMVGIDHEHDRERGFTVTESGITVVAKGQVVTR